MTAPADLSALLAHLDALAAEATAGEWEVKWEGQLDSGCYEVWPVAPAGLPVAMLGDAEDSRDDAAFIVALVNGYPALAAALRGGEARVAELKDNADWWQSVSARLDSARLAAIGQMESLQPPHDNTEGWCRLCGGRNLPSWFVVSAYWNLAFRGEDGEGRYKGQPWAEIACPQCFVSAFEEAGGTAWTWEMRPDPWQHPAEWDAMKVLAAERDAALARADAAEADADRRVEELDRLYHGGYLTDEQFEDAFRDHAAAMAMRNGEGTT